MLPAPLPTVRDLVSERTAQGFEEATAHLGALGAPIDDLLAPARELLAGGKRTRALLVAAGSMAVAAWDAEEPPRGILRAGAALELFQASALVHDDVMDAADTRRGMPSAHRTLEAGHRARALAGSAEHHGVSGAILLGDLLLAAAGTEMDAMALTDLGLDGRAARRIFDEMSVEVAAGQYLDVLASSTPLDRDPGGALERAMSVLVHKSARYSVEHPLALGATLAGAAPELVAALRAVGLPLGQAFQLRDDELGVFGDPRVTGKPAGDDLREGKRTALLALAYERASDAQRSVMVNLVGSPDLDEAGVGALREILIASGARAAHEDLIAEVSATAETRLTEAPLAPGGRAALAALTRALVARAS